MLGLDLYKQQWSTIQSTTELVFQTQIVCQISHRTSQTLFYGYLVLTQKSNIVVTVTMEIWHMKEETKGHDVKYIKLSATKPIEFDKAPFVTRITRIIVYTDFFKYEMVSTSHTPLLGYLPG